MLGQPLPQSLPLHRRSAGDLVDVHLPCLTPPLQPALDGRAGDSKEFSDLPSWDATVDGSERLQSEVFRVCVHEEHSHVGPLLKQAAVRTKRRLDGPDVADTVLVPEHYGYPYHVVYGVRVKLCYWALNPNRPRRYDKIIPLYYPLVVPKSRSMISSFG